MQSPQLHKRVAFFPKQVNIGGQLPISRALIVRYIFQKLFAPEEDDISLIDLKRGEAGGEVERVGQEVVDDDVLPLIVGDVVFLDIHLFVLWDAEAEDVGFVGGFLEDTGGLVRLDAVQTAQFAPLLALEGVADASAGPLAFVDHAADEVDVLVVVDQTVAGVHCVGQF